MEPVSITPPPSASAVSSKNEERARQNAHILSVFEEMSRTHGPRSVVMGELAKTLGMSTKTLYKNFPKKKHLVSALMEKWSAELLDKQNNRINQGMTPKDRITDASVDWLNQTSQFSEIFWAQLERDFPDAFKVYEEGRRVFFDRSRKNLTNSIREELNADLALSNLLAVIANSTNQKLCTQLNITRKDAVVDAVDLWAKGALKEYS